MFRLGVYGHGPQSKRYLDPLNWPGGVMVEQLERDDAPKGLQGCIVANAPAHHAQYTIEALRAGIPVLCEKPMALSMASAEAMVVARGGATPLVIAHTHLWHPEFRELVGSKQAMVQWCGEERADGSCPAMLDWGPHAWSMAIALGTDRVITGKGDRSKNIVKSRGKEYPRPLYMPHRPMRAMLETFVRVVEGGYDWRADPNFAMEVHRRCFNPYG